MGLGQSYVCRHEVRDLCHCSFLHVCNLDSDMFLYIYIINNYAHLITSPSKHMELDPISLDIVLAPRCDVLALWVFQRLLLE